MVQQALLQVLDPLFDPDMSDRSFGFRKGRKAHHAIATVIRDAKAGYRHVVDADIASFFDRLDHQVVMSRVRARVGDGRVLDLIEAFLKAGVCEAGVVSVPQEGTPQGGVITPRTQEVMSAVSRVIRIGVSRGRWAASVRWPRGRRDAVTDNDRIIAYKDLLDDQPDDTLPFDYVKRVGGHAQPREERSERLREMQVRGALPRLISDRLLLGAQRLLALAQRWHPLPQLFEGQELFLVGREQPLDAFADAYELALQRLLTLLRRVSRARQRVGGRVPAGSTLDLRATE